MRIQVIHTTPQSTSNSNRWIYDYQAFEHAYPLLAPLVLSDGGSAEAGTKIDYTGFYPNGEPFCINVEVLEQPTCGQPTLGPDDSIKPCIKAPNHTGEFCDTGVR